MPQPTRPQDVDPDKPEVDADQERPPTPQGRTDNAAEHGDGPSTGSLNTDGDGEDDGRTT